MTKYAHNHYVPEWYQKRFLLSDQGERKFFHLDLRPETFKDPNGITRSKSALHRWGARNCFAENNLYTTKFGDWKSTEIEEKFFGAIDTKGRAAVEWCSKFQHPCRDHPPFNDLLVYMSTQKLRTPKGLAWLAARVGTVDHNAILVLMQQYRQLFGAVWTECVWQIADASNADVKFIVSDHPITAYNSQCFPGSKWCQGVNDPDVRLHGTHTLFPLSLDKILILTNLSWVRNPYQNPRAARPNPNLFRSAIFDIRTVQTQRLLSPVEVQEINFIIKRRAFRYIAAAREEWLYPENQIPTQHWSKLGSGLLLMPDPRSVMFSRNIVFGYRDGSDAFDEYGRRPGQKDYNDESLADLEWETFHRFQGEFARKYGPLRRGRAYNMMHMDPERDDEEYHQYHLSLEKKRLKRGNKKARGP